MEAEFNPLALNTNMRDFLGSNVAHFHSEDRQEFYEFSSARVSSRTLLFATTYALAVVFYYFTFAFIHATTEHALSFIPAAFTLLFRIPIALLLLYIRKKIERKEVISQRLGVYQVLRKYSYGGFQHHTHPSFIWPTLQWRMFVIEPVGHVEL
jgi:hypothetical protein